MANPRMIVIIRYARLNFLEAKNRTKKHEKIAYKKQMALVPVKIYVIGKVTMVEIIASFDKEVGRFIFLVTKNTIIGSVDGNTVRKTFIDTPTSNPLTIDSVDKRMCMLGACPYSVPYIPV
jgi:GTP1/Obg family GTP-binding protein